MESFEFYFILYAISCFRFMARNFQFSNEAGDRPGKCIGLIFHLTQEQECHHV